MNNLDNQDKIAYLSLEIALDENLSTYAGGLGILAGDFLRSAADLNLPLIGVSLLNKEGYFKQEINSLGEQLAIPETNDLRELKKAGPIIEINLGTDKVFICAWQYMINDKLPVYLLDTDLPENKDEYRGLTNKLYRHDSIYRLQQAVILGRGGVKILKALGYKIKKFHINESHGVLSALELLAETKGEIEDKQRAQLKKQLIFTNHTPIKTGQDIFPAKIFLQYQPDFPAYLENLLINKEVNLTQLAVELAGQTNGVSRQHQKTLKKDFPHNKINYITNGVHAKFWSSPEFIDLYNKYLPGWPLKNSLLRKVRKIPIKEIAQAHLAAKKRLLKYIFEKYQINLQPEIMTIVFARRFTYYKQPLLLLSNLEKLLAINKKWPLQIIYAGKAHPQDHNGQKMIKEIYELKEKYQSQLKIVFLENYNISLAKLLVAGADLWLNNPLPPNEACGTSGMKAALNGVPQLSSPDGWWLEAYKKNKNGWLIKDSQAENLYKSLEKEILPLYYQQPEKWSKLRRSTIYKTAPIYNSERMLREYWRQNYN